MNKGLYEEKIRKIEMAKRISKPAIRLFSLEKIRLELNLLVSESDSLIRSNEIEELSLEFDELFHSYYNEELVKSV